MVGASILLLVFLFDFLIVFRKGVVNVAFYLGGELFKFSVFFLSFHCAVINSIIRSFKSLFRKNKRFEGEKSLLN